MKFFPNIHIHIHLASVDEDVLQKLANLQTSFTTSGNTIMATITEIQTAIAQNATDAASEKLEVNAKLTAVASTLSTLEATVASLQAQIAAGTGVTAAQLDGILAGVQSTGADIRGIFTPDATAAPAPAPALVVVPVAPI